MKNVTPLRDPIRAHTNSVSSMKNSATNWEEITWMTIHSLPKGQFSSSCHLIFVDCPRVKHTTIDANGEVYSQKATTTIQCLEHWHWEMGKSNLWLPYETGVKMCIVTLSPRYLAYAVAPNWIMATANLQQ